MKSIEKLQDRYLGHILDGDRRRSRALLLDAKTQGISPVELLLDVIWVCMERISGLFREDSIDFVAEHQATRINRSLADQMQTELSQAHPTGQKAIVCCSDQEENELGAQIMADLFEADGWDVLFIGSGVPMDELIQLVGRTQPDMLIYFGTEPGGIPEIRRTLQLLHKIGASPDTRVLASGGVFNRAEGLWIEVGADAFAPNARSALDQAREGISLREHPVPVEGQPKRRRRRGSALVSANKG